MKNKKYTIGIDLGGTNFRIGLVSEHGKILYQSISRVGTDRSPKGIVTMLCEAVTSPSTHSPLANSLRAGARAIGIGAPGIVDFEKGIIVRSPHYPKWKGFNLRSMLSKATGLPVVLDNDANMIAAGEAWIGAGRGVKNFIMMTLGTGIGGGIVIDGKIFHGDEGFAGEIGHQVLEFNGSKCGCGGRGCFETIVSIGGIKRISGHDSRELEFLAKQGNVLAKRSWEKFGRYLGAGVASLVNVTGIHTVIVGGGISNAWDCFISSAKKEISERTYKETAKRIVIKRAKLGESAGILGAAKCLLDTSNNPEFTGTSKKCPYARRQ